MDYLINEINSGNFRSLKGAVEDIGKIVYSFNDKYPDIKSWFLDKVVPGLESGERSMLYVLKQNEIVGLTILKDSISEKKICTFYVSPNMRGRGLAPILFEKSFDKLKTAKPVISVPEIVLGGFRKYIDQYKFDQTDSRFLPNQRLREFEYNGN